MRNEFIIPDGVQTRPGRGCPVCSSMNFGGEMKFGVVSRKCRDCGNEWVGGTGVVAEDPTVPRPPQDPRSLPVVDFAYTREGGATPQDVISRRPNIAQPFRGGALIRDEED